jgi:hypothetical protein
MTKDDIHAKIDLDPDLRMSLDDLVHDVKSREASEINNEGTERQIDYLISVLGVDGLNKALQEA